jgi:thymidylate synthase ThyX
MEKPAAIQQIRDVCNSITREIMRIHPAVPPLADKEAQDEIYKALFELTKNVEIIKKRLAKLEAKDGSTLL